jgi:hypothetical protein
MSLLSKTCEDELIYEVVALIVPVAFENLDYIMFANCNELC